MFSSCDINVVDGYVIFLNFTGYFSFKNEFILSQFLWSSFFSGNLIIVLLEQASPAEDFLGLFYVRCKVQWTVSSTT